MSNINSKISSITLTALLIASVAFTVWFFSSTARVGTIPEGITQPSAKIEWQMGEIGPSLSGILTFSYCLVIFVVLATILFGGLGMVKKSKSNYKTFLSFGVMIVLFVISFILASPVLPDNAEFIKVLEKFFASNVSEANTTLKGVDTIIIVTYLLFLISILSMLFFGVQKFFVKKKG